MNPGNVFVAGEQKAKNFFHIMVDNNMYESTGGQKTCHMDWDFAEMARLAGYQTCFSCNGIAGFSEALRSVYGVNKGSVFFHLIVKEKTQDIADRISISLPEIRKRLYKILKGKDESP